MQDEPPAGTTDLPSTLLANSLCKTSEKIRLVLTSPGCDTFPAELKVTNLHRAAKERNGNVVAAIWQQADWNYLSTPISHQSSGGQVDQRLDVEARDFRGRTALFLAADTGVYQVCYFLLQTARADPNTRDSCGHTVLGVAAKGGHLQVVQYLVAAGAIVNPLMTSCASSPLQAAVESAHSHAGLIEYLLEERADPHVRRLFDYKNIIEIAETKGLYKLIQRMRRAPTPKDIL